ncbi:hypothetical protein Fcan01_00896 [Folsomia candida]|uniref:Uncharacterized protein n=1 Tax=Folsomia candida TaxID=158441 RepID=A0A226F7C5_FOLCA|nr:hypothetical protein Fcan01_00896 [Folsomia candida]
MTYHYNQLIDILHGLNHLSRIRNSYGKPVLIGFSHKYSNWLRNAETLALSPRGRFETSWILLGVLMKSLNLTSFSDEDVKISEKLSRSINMDDIFRICVDCKVLPNDSDRKDYSIAEIFNNDVVYIYCEAKARLSQNLGVAIFFVPFQTSVWLVLAMFMVLVLLRHQSFWRGFDFILLLGGIPPRDRWWRRKSVSAVLFFLGFFHLNSLYVCYITSDVTAALLPRQIRTNKELFVGLGYKLFLPETPIDDLEGRINAYFNKENDRAEFVRFKIPISKSLFIEEYCRHHSLVCVGKNPDKGTTRILKKLAIISIDNIKRVSGQGQINCNIVAEIWSKIWQTWHFSGPDAAAGLELFNGLVEMGLIPFWEGVYWAAQMRDNKVGVETKTQEMVKFTPIKLNSNIFMVFGSLASFMGICVVTFGAEVLIKYKINM